MREKPSHKYDSRHYSFRGTREHDRGVGYDSWEEFEKAQIDFTLDEMFAVILQNGLRVWDRKGEGALDEFDEVYFETYARLVEAGVDFSAPIPYSEIHQMRAAIYDLTHEIAVERGVISPGSNLEARDRMRELVLRLRIKRFGLPGGM